MVFLPHLSIRLFSFLTTQLFHLLSWEFFRNGRSLWPRRPGGHQTTCLQARLLLTLLTVQVFIETTKTLRHLGNRVRCPGKPQDRWLPVKDGLTIEPLLTFFSKTPWLSTNTSGICKNRSVNRNAETFQQAIPSNYAQKETTFKPDL